MCIGLRRSASPGEDDDPQPEIGKTAGWLSRRQAVDITPAAELIATLSQIAAANRDTIQEMEFNPVILHADGSGMTVADALIVLKP